MRTSVWTSGHGLSALRGDQGRKKVKIGARVKAVFEEKRAGKITDVRHFVVID